MRFKLTSFAIPALALLIAGCAGGPAYSAYKLESAPLASALDKANSSRIEFEPNGSTAGQAAQRHPAGPPPVADAPTTAPAERRQVIYSASFRVVVADVAASIRTVIELSERLGGYMQEVAGSTLSVRVPAKRFDDAVAAIEKTGEVVDRQLKASDVTEEMHDLHIRLDNAEKLRTRLLDILAKSQKVEDALKVEAELARVSEQIDQAKGRIRYLESQIAMSTIRVEFNAAAKTNPNSNGPLLPFRWVDELGAGLVAGDVRQNVQRVGLFARGPRFKTPTGFVKFFEDKDRAEAMDAAGLLVRVRGEENVDKAPLAFWSKLVRKSLVEGRALSVDREETVDNGKVYLLRGRRDVAGKPVAYLLSLERSDKHVIVFEAWGPEATFKEAEGSIRTAAESVEPG